MVRARTTTPSSAAGGRKLPGGRAALLLAMALVASCGAPAVSARPPVASPAAPLVTEPGAPVPMLGEKPPSGLVLPSYFVAVTSSSNGAISVLTTPSSRCDLIVDSPSGASADAGERVADASGIAGWVYPPLPDHGASRLTVRCSLAGQTQTAQAQVLLP